MSGPRRASDVQAGALTKDWQVLAPALWGWTIVGEYDSEKEAATSPQYRIAGSVVRRNPDAALSPDHREEADRA